MLYKHPKTRYVPHVQLSLSELAELCNGLLGTWTHGEHPSYIVSFQGTDGSEISTSDVSLITPDNERVPSLIVQPTIVASAGDDIIELRSQIVPATSPGASATSFYVFNVTGSRPGWSASVIETMFEWLKRRRTGSFKFHLPIFFGLIFLAAFCLITGLVSGLAGSKSVIHFTSLVISLLVTGFAFLVAAIGFDRSHPRFSVVVRPVAKRLTMANLAMLVGIVAGLVAVYNEVRKAIGK